MAIKVHRRLIREDYYDAILYRGKRFEIRKEDRGRFEVGDLLRLIPTANRERMEHPSPHGIGSKKGHITARICYVLRDFDGVEEGYAILGLEYVHVIAADLPDPGTHGGPI